MGLFSSITSVVSSAVSQAQQAVENTPSPPAPSTPPPQPKGFSQQSDFVSGGKASPSETLVANRVDPNVPMRLYGSSQAERLANLPRLTQIDGDQKSDQDRTTCGVQCVVSTMYVQHPDQLPKVAAYLTDKQGENLDRWATECGLDPKAARADMEAIKSGTASPRQLSTLSQLLYRDTKERCRNQNVPMRDDGLSHDALQVLTKDILKDQCNCDPGPMRMSLHDVKGGGHWIAQMDVATMKDVQENAKNDCVVTFDPSPNGFGMAPTGVAIDRSGADAQQTAARGKPTEEIDVGADGKITKKELPPLPPDLPRTPG
jgi:hypothetical protein